MKLARTALVAAVLPLLALSACGGDGSSSDNGDEKSPFVIGVTAAATGPAASFGKAEFDAANLAVEEINAAGGINGRKIELVLEDDEAKPDKGASITQRFIARKVHAILGTASSGVALASVPIADQAGYLYLAAMPANPAVTKNEDGTPRKWVFRVAQSDTENAQKLGDFAFGKYERVALMSDTTGYGGGGRAALKDYLKTIGKSLVADETYATGAPDVTPQLRRVANSRAEVLIVWGIHTDAATILKGMKSNGLTFPALGLPGLGGVVMCDLAGDNAIGLLHLDSWDDRKPEAKALSAKWQTKYGQPLTNYFGASAYDGIQLLAQALKVGGDDREAVRKALESTSKYVGSLGTTGAGITFSTENHDGLDKDGIVVKRVTNKACNRETIA